MRSFSTPSGLLVRPRECLKSGLMERTFFQHLPARRCIRSATTIFSLDFIGTSISEDLSIREEILSFGRLTRKMALFIQPGSFLTKDGKFFHKEECLSKRMFLGA